ncbi:MAG: hypothetical protein JW762_06265 [Dehalococcoidales bacterium]|nr:hypothetical protein [Dehalococcoidales bacterium]
MEEPVHKTSTEQNIRKLTLPNGLQVGIIALDAIMKEIADLNLTDHGEIQAELLSRVKRCNFVVTGAEKEYASALLEEYRNKYDISEPVKQKTHKKSHAG